MSDYASIGNQLFLGSLFMVGLPGTRLDRSTRELIAKEKVNDFILFKRNIEDPEQLKQLCQELKSDCLAAGLDPPLVAIDQEGGSVSRLPAPFTQFPDARCLAQSADPEAALIDYATTCARELLGLGINLNFAPVLDVCPEGEGYYIEKRSLGAEPQRVAELGQLVIRTMQEQGLAACAKHFPGLGRARLDPHSSLPTLTISLDELNKTDLPPFLAAIEAGVATVMTSHTIYPALDPDRPATLSPLIIEGLLREKMGYQGVIVTDDLEMGAIENDTLVTDAVVLSVEAGADLLLICHDHGKVRACLERLSTELGATGRISRERLLKSARRIKALRARL